MSNPVKILAVGSAAGSIQDLFAKIQSIDTKHGKFDFALCVGDFFGPAGDSDEGQEQNDVSRLLAGELEPSIECYIMQGENPLPKIVVEKFAQTGGELCKNVFLLSKSGIITTTAGLRIACLGGTYDLNVHTSTESPPGFMSPFFSALTIERLLSNTMSKSSGKQDYGSLASIQSSSSTSQAVDIFLTNVWPTSVTQFSSSPLSPPELALISAPPMDSVVDRLKPRYHFATCAGKHSLFWEREPYISDEESTRISRFVSLGAFGVEQSIGKRKQRWFYAFSISPVVPGNAANPRPSNATPNPFTQSAQLSSKRPLDTAGENYIFGNVTQPSKRPKTGQSESGKPPPGHRCRRCDSSEHFAIDCPERTTPPEGYICKICQTPGHFVRDCPTRDAVGDTGGKKPKPGYVCRACGSENHYLDDCPINASSRSHQHDRPNRKGPPKEIGPDECWFCLSNPNLAKHLIVGIGSECYLTLPKGQIIPTHADTRRSDIPGGGHVLIVPIAHFPTYNTIPPDLTPPIQQETDKLQLALRALYAKHGCAFVSFEIARLTSKGGHAHIQVVPIPNGLKNEVEDAFIRVGRSQGIDFEQDPQAALESCTGGRGSYFRVNLPDGRVMVHLMKDHVPFSIQFGRQVLVTLLGMPDRLDWKTCALSEEEDRADAQAFKAAFAPFDPTTV